MPKGRSTTNQEKRQAAKRADRERAISRANNIVQNNLTQEQKEARRGGTQ